MSSVQNICVFSKQGLADSHCETNNHDAEERNNEGTSLSDAIRDVRNDNGEDGSRNVNRNRHELGCARRVPETANDRREE